jgi:phage FluMu protein Com
MASVRRSSDQIEGHWARAITYGLSGIGALALATLLYVFRGQTGMFVPLAILLFVIGGGLVLYGIYCALQVRGVPNHRVPCPYCKATNGLTEPPTQDFTCSECHRLIPIRDGQSMAVDQVRCGYCNALNFYSAKTEVLLCEECNHEIPISTDGAGPQRTLPKGFAVVDDESTYDLILVGYGHKTEELILCLQHMLALNRNQVKQMLTELPVTLLTGISRKKAEMLQAQLSVHEGASDVKPHVRA